METTKIVSSMQLQSIKPTVQHVSQLAAAESAINDDRRYRSGRDRRQHAWPDVVAHLRSIQWVSPDVFSITGVGIAITLPFCLSETGKKRLACLWCFACTSVVTKRNITEYHLLFVLSTASGINDHLFTFKRCYGTSQKHEFIIIIIITQWLCPRKFSGTKLCHSAMTWIFIHSFIWFEQ